MFVLQMIGDYLSNPLFSNLFEATYISSDKTLESIVAVSNSYNNQNDGIPKNVKVFAYKSLVGRVLFFPKQKVFFEYLRKLPEIGDVRIVHAHTLFANGYAAYRLKKKLNIPYVVTVNNTDKNLFFKYMFYLRGVGNKILRGAEKVFFISTPYRDSVIEKYVHKKHQTEIMAKSIVIPYGIDNIFFEDKPSAKIVDSTVKAIFVGRVEKNKNLEAVVGALDLIRKAGVSVELVVIGEMVDESYKDLIKSRNYIEYKGKCTKFIVKEELAKANILILPSHKETFGLVYAEAMSQGLPVIYTKGQGFDGQFPEGEIGFAVIENSPDDIKEKIELILADYHRMSENCLKNVWKFKWSDIADQYIKIYEEVLETK